MSEFLKGREDVVVPKKKPVVEEAAAPVEPAAPEEEAAVEDVAVEEPSADFEDLEVQKAVVESLAAEKVEQQEIVRNLRKDNYILQTELASLKEKVEQMKAPLEKVGDVLAANANPELSTKVTLLERTPELQDNFEGETRDHLLEVIRAARDQAEAEGRCRRAQVLEGVLVANEPNGTLEKKRAALEKLFADNQYILNGHVINELDKMGIPYKNGENYLLPAEIIKRTY